MDALQLIQSIALIMILASHYILIRGCFGIKTELPNQGGAITEQIGEVCTLLDEMAQLISDMLDSTPATGSNPPPDSVFGQLVNSLISKTLNPNDHATTSEERPIHEIISNPPTTNEEENQSWEHPTELPHS